MKMIFFRGLQLILGPDGHFCKKSFFGRKSAKSANPSCFQVKIYLKSFRKNISVGATTPKSAENGKFLEQVLGPKNGRRVPKSAQNNPIDLL